MSALETIFDHLALRPETPLFHEVQGSHLQTTKRGAFLTLVSKARRFIIDAGIRKGDRVGLLAPNSTHWAAIDLALLSHGAISVPLYSRQNPAELASMLRDCGATFLIGGTPELVEGVRKNWPACCRTALFSDLLASETTDEKPVVLEENDPITIIYTSGTSGEPKGAILTRKNMDFMVPTTASALDRLLGSGEKEDHPFHYLPFCFAGSRVVLWTQLYRGNSLMLSTDLNNLPEELATARPQYMLNVPALLERIRRKVEDGVQEKGGLGAYLYGKGMAAAARKGAGKSRGMDALWRPLSARLVFSKIKEKIGPRMDFLICGSAPLSPETQRWYATLAIPVYQVYGLTETSAIVTMDRPPEVEAGTVGPAIDGIEMCIAEDGELLTRGPHIFSGYWNRPEATASALKGGWFHTGDQGSIDEKGNYRISGRSKNVLVPESGHNVAPEPLEHALLTACPELEQAVVIGHGRHHLLVIVSGPASDETLASALETVNASLPHYRHLRGFIRATEPFSDENGQLTANQKVRRNQIDTDYKEAIEEAYA